MTRAKASFHSNMKSLSFYQMLRFATSFHKILKELKRTSTTTYFRNYFGYIKCSAIYKSSRFTEYAWTSASEYILNIL